MLTEPRIVTVTQLAADDRDTEIARALDAMLGSLTEPADERTDERPE